MARTERSGAAFPRLITNPGYDKAGILAILDDWRNVQRDPNEDLRAIELAEEREP